MDDIRKQLPLRQQRDKPTLKYSSTTTHGVPYYQGGTASSGFSFPNKPRPGSGKSQAEASSRVYHGSYSCLSNDNTLSNIYGSQAVSQQQYVPQPAYAGYLFMSGTGTPSGVALTPAQILAASIQTSTKINKNPYAQPISLADLAPPPQPEVQSKPSTVPLGSTSGSSVSSNGSNLSMNNPSPTPNSLQTNSFMRPQSAVTTDANGNITKTTPPRAAAVSRASEKTETNSRASTPNHYINRSNLTEFLKTQPAPRPPSGIKPNSRPNSGTSRTAVPEGGANMVHVQGTKKVMVPAATPVTRPPMERQATPQTVLFKPPTGPSAVQRTNSMPSSPSNRFIDRFKRPESGRQSGSHDNNNSSDHVKNDRLGNQSKANNQESSTGQWTSPDNYDNTTRPGSSLHRSATPEMKVRNPNYTPTKPYSEVSNPVTTVQEQPKATSSDDVMTTTDAVTSCPNTPPRQMKQTDKKPPIPGKKPDPAKDAPLKKMPMTNTGNGTVFYRKSSKAEEVIDHLKKRPLADGAPAEVTVVEQVTSQDDDDDDEWTTDEDEAADEDTKSNNPTSAYSICMRENERLPGDGEDNSHYGDDDDDDDDDALDNLEDDICGSDDESDTYSITTSLASRRSSASIRVRSATKRLQNLSLQDGAPIRARSAKARPSSSVSRVSVSSDTDTQPALMPSLFPNVPPTVNFVIDGEKVETLPWEFRKLLKWRMSPITPNVVKNCIARSGFRATKKNHDWLGYWGKHMKAQGFKAIREYQKINHFPGSFQIGRKDRLWRNLSKMQVHFGKKEFGFFPQTFILPFDMKQLKRAWEDGGNKQKWIIKPPASARGIGIKVISKWNQIPKKRSVIVQRYLGRPYLINDSKFDLRIYVYVTSYDPLRIYIYDDGLTRFASCKYSYAMKNLNNKYMHLTNYSINKKNDEYESNTDENICQGHKWGLKALWGYLKKQGINTNSVWENIKDLVIKTIISSESCVNSMVKANVRRRYCCHELFGFDVMLDENLKPWIIEVNISPSLHSNSPLDMNIKGGMIKDLFNLSGFMLPDKNDVTPSGITGQYDSSRYAPANPLVIDKRLYPTQMSPDERAKHAYYCQRHLDEFVQQTILDTITPDDLRMLIETIDEDSRRGNFQRVFPNATSHKFLRFFEQPRYYQLLMNQWVQKYNRMEARGIALLESLCVRGTQLENPTDDPRHQWAPPSTTIPREPRPVGSAPITSQAKSGSLPTLKKKKPAVTDMAWSQCSSTPTTSRPPTARSAASMPSS